MNMLKNLWSKEPAVVTLLGSAVFWPALFNLLTAFGHGLTQSQEQALSVFAMLLAGYIVRGQVSPTPTGTGLSVDLNKVGKLAILLSALSLFNTACTPTLTPVANIADKAARAQSVIGEILRVAQQQNATINPVTGKPILSRSTLDVIALAVDKAGRGGVDLGNLLNSYLALKAAGKDTATLVPAIQLAITSITNTLADVGKAVPNGTIVQIDQAVVQAIGLYAQVRSGL